MREEASYTFKVTYVASRISQNYYIYKKRKKEKNCFLVIYKKLQDKLFQITLRLQKILRAENYLQIKNRRKN